MTIAEARELIAKLHWTFAKTYANKSPHEYAICRPKDELRKEMLEFAALILVKGHTELYFGHPFIVYKLDGRKYWTMVNGKDELDNEFFIINRSMEHNANTVYK